MTTPMPSSPIVVQDDRTAAERISHVCFVKARDTFLSGYGDAEGGTSYAVWCCRPADHTKVGEWVKGRAEMVDLTTDFNPDTYKLKRRDRIHIYVVNDNHAATKADRNVRLPGNRTQIGM